MLEPACLVMKWMCGGVVVVGFECVACVIAQRVVVGFKRET